MTPLSSIASTAFAARLLKLIETWYAACSPSICLENVYPFLAFQHTSRLF